MYAIELPKHLFDVILPCAVTLTAKPLVRTSASTHCKYEGRTMMEECKQTDTGK